MSNKTLKTPLILAAGAILTIVLSATSVVNAADNPFSMTSLSSGYLVASADGKCGSGKCGGDKAGEAKCGGDKAGEAKCGGDKAGEAKCGGDKGGEAKCGGDKKAGEAKCGGNK
jgi:uncharacterized low-complexity protein